MKNIIHLALVLLLTTFTSCLADDIPKDGLLLWLNAGSVEAKDNSVIQLTDLSGKGNHAKRGTEPKSVPTNPVLVPNAANGQPVLRFSGKLASFGFNEITKIRTVFWVVSKDAAAFKQKQELFVLGGTKTLDFHPGTHFTDTILHATPQYGSPALQKGSAWINGKPMDARTTDFPRTLSLITLQATADVKADQVAKDRQFPDRCWQGDIAEILLYDRALSDAERKSVETHLMGKYAIKADAILSP